ncbi:autoinducer binding domain-containing protein [Mesorhizobium captivum]|uniref:autoinducer binding domain-containing protein n=1 Tax=Mesorhizobium captivum TaxID=3072319 RepID=UPI003D31E7E8
MSHASLAPVFEDELDPGTHVQSDADIGEWVKRVMIQNVAPGRRIVGEAAEVGIKSGFTISIRTGFGRIALLFLASERTEPDRVAIRDETHAARTPDRSASSYAPSRSQADGDTMPPAGAISTRRRSERR